MPNETCVLIHGFTGAPSELTPLAEALAERDYNVICPTLAGHDGTFFGLKGTSAEDWLESAAAPVRAASQTGPVHLIGFSMGGLIAAVLAQRESVASVTFLSPAIRYARPNLMLRQARVFIKGHLQRDSEEALYLRKRPSGFLLTPPSSLKQLATMVDLAKQALPEVRVPACVMQGDCDEIVDPASAAYVYHHLTSSVHRELHRLPKSRHHVCLDVESAEVIKHVTEFLAKVHEVTT